jgi:hypothetical protein
MDGSSYLERMQGEILSVSSLLLIRMYLVHGFLGVADQFGVPVGGWKDTECSSSRKDLNFVNKK